MCRKQMAQRQDAPSCCQNCSCLNDVYMSKATKAARLKGCSMRRRRMCLLPAVSSVSSAAACEMAHEWHGMMVLMALYSRVCTCGGGGEAQQRACREQCRRMAAAGARPPHVWIAPAGRSANRLLQSVWKLLQH